MAIKWKNYKTISFLMAGAAVLAATIGFMALYPVFDKNVGTEKTDFFHSDYFLQKMGRSNYLLYKDIREKVDETKYTYSDLYLDIKRETATVFDYNVDVSYMPFNEFQTMAESTMNDIFSIWKENDAYVDMQGMDYCVIDETTGKYIKNTGENIETLAGMTAEEKASLPYVYYILMNYDNAGNPGKMLVKSKNPDMLMKSMQRIQKEINWESEADRYGGFHGAGTYYLSDDESGIRIDMVEVLPKNFFANTTYIYALTEEQADNLITAGSNNFYNNKWLEESEYQDAGVFSAFACILAILFILSLLFSNYKKYCLHKLKIFKIPLEISIAGMVLFAAFCSSEIISLVNSTGRGYFEDFYRVNAAWLGTFFYSEVTCAINILFLFLLFGIWYYFSTSFGMVTELGIGGFLKERSLIVKAGKGCVNFVKRYCSKFKEEMLHADLGKDMLKLIRKIVFINFVILAVICTFWLLGWIAIIIYSVVLYFIVKKYASVIQEQYRKLLRVTGSIADGNLNTVMDEDLGVFESYKEALQQIQDGFKKAVDEEVKSQRMKTELITNVSHDLKTPLTAITTYVELLKEENITEEQRKEYIGVLERKSLRLKFLIEDLFEVSKASSGNVTLNLIDVDICNLMRQVYLEYEDKVEEADLIFRFHIPEDRVMLKLDSQKSYRIFENLYTNIIKYAMPHTRVYVEAQKTEKGIRIELKNMSAVELSMAADELMERFVRGDGSRNTEGSGLGLAIARSFTELQKGKMEVSVDGDLFKVVLEWER